MATFVDNAMKKLSLKNEKKINILLIGETGVGKSTFINAIYNYLQFSSFEEARKDTIKVLIPSMFIIADKDGEYKEVSIGNATEDKNESINKKGDSVTQKVQTYSFVQENETIRLIDTPGMGDTRGLTQDDTNCESILDYIGNLHELHCICFLFKSKNSRSTVYFRYCIDQIFSRLDKSAKDNLVFVFTNTRGDNFTAGDTFATLKAVLDDLKNSQSRIEIPFNAKNMFYFDNEGFRLQAALDKGIEVKDDVKKISIQSWNESRDQTVRLLEYIKSLKPHHVRNTKCVNEARHMIINLARPMADIATLISDNLRVLSRHQARLADDKQSIDQLKDKLFMPVIDLKETRLAHPATVCSSEKCTEVVRVDGQKKTHYKTPCHAHCYLTNVPAQIIGSPELLHCAAMGGTDRCKECSCSYQTHQHIYYTTECQSKKVVDKNISRDISSKTEALDRAKQQIQRIEQKKIELEAELSTILECNAMFATFLKNNAIVPFCDSYLKYIEYLIDRESNMCEEDRDVETLNELHMMRNVYLQKKATLEKALTLKTNLLDTQLTPTKIQESIQHLYRLKHMGAKIKSLYNLQKTAKNREYQVSEHTEYIGRGDKTKDKTKDDKKQGKGQQQNNQNQKDGRKPRGGTHQGNRGNYNNQGNRGNYSNQGNRGNHHNQNRNSNHPNARGRSPPPTYHQSVYVPPPPPPPPQGGYPPHYPPYGHAPGYEHGAASYNYSPQYGYQHPPYNSQDRSERRDSRDRSSKKENINITVTLDKDGRASVDSRDRDPPRDQGYSHYTPPPPGSYGSGPYPGPSGPPSWGPGYPPYPGYPPHPQGGHYPPPLLPQNYGHSSQPGPNRGGYNNHRGGSRNSNYQRQQSGSSSQQEQHEGRTYVRRGRGRGRGKNYQKRNSSKGPNHEDNGSDSDTSMYSTKSSRF